MRLAAGGRKGPSANTSLVRRVFFIFFLLRIFLTADFSVAWTVLLVNLTSQRRCQTPAAWCHCRSILRWLSDGQAVNWQRTSADRVALKRFALPGYFILPRGFTSQTASKSWSEICLRHHWNLAQYFATLPVHRWIKRVMAWHPEGHRRIGRPNYRWDSMIENFSRLKDIPSWEMAAMDDGLWRSLFPDFLDFCNRWCIGNSFTIPPPVPETGCPMGHTGLTIDHWLAIPAGILFENGLQYVPFAPTMFSKNLCWTVLMTGGDVGSKAGNGCVILWH